MGKSTGSERLALLSVQAGAKCRAQPGGVDLRAVRARPRRVVSRLGATQLRLPSSPQWVSGETRRIPIKCGPFLHRPPFPRPTYAGFLHACALLRRKNNTQRPY